MGLCVSFQVRRQDGIFVNLASAVQIIHWNGRLQELWYPINAGEILSQNPNYFLCNSETMNVNSIPSQMANDELLQPGQLYFLVPVSILYAPFTLQELCKLALKASKALNDSEMGLVTFHTSVTLSDGNSAKEKSKQLNQRRLDQVKGI